MISMFHFSCLFSKHIPFQDETSLLSNTISLSGAQGAELVGQREKPDETEQRNGDLLLGMRRDTRGELGPSLSVW